MSKHDKSRSGECSGWPIEFRCCWSLREAAGCRCTRSRRPCLDTRRTCKTAMYTWLHPCTSYKYTDYTIRARSGGARCDSHHRRHCPLGPRRQSDALGIPNNRARCRQPTPWPLRERRASPDCYAHSSNMHAMPMAAAVMEWSSSGTNHRR
jgi:hypothetical protein